MAAEPISFHRDVMAVLSKAGCNAGRCHGNSNGRGGFWLSLRGQTPREDYLALTRDLWARRINRARPEESLILKKATAQVPHEGGRRFPEESLEYVLLQSWISAGAPWDEPSAGQVVALQVSPENAIVVAPAQSLQLRVTAIWPDGTRRDVTELAVYEPADLRARVQAGGRVEREKLGETHVVVRFLNQQAVATLAFLDEAPREELTELLPPARNVVDAAVYAKLRRLGIVPAEPVDDVGFLRRVSLDLIGALPTAEEARAFAESRSPRKRAEWIDRLLAHPYFADYWALKWCDLLRVEEKTLDARGVEGFHGWIRDAIANDLPLDTFVREILTAQGSTYEHPPSNFYRAVRQPDELAEAVAQVFLGVRLRCAKCHDHPFDRWSQDSYYGFAALFAPIEYEIIENKRRDKFDKNQFIGEQIVRWTGPTTVRHPDKQVAVPARFLHNPPPQPPRGTPDIEAFAAWLTGGEHPLFARVLVNRVWAELMGRGIVEPVDDFRGTNPPSNPELLDALTEYFVQHDYRLRPLVRLIVNSRVYQASTVPATENAADAAAENFSYVPVRRLTAEQLLDAISAVTGVPSEFDGYDQPLRATAVPGINKTYRREAADGSERFLQVFGKPARIMTCACERSNETALNQVFTLTSGQLLQGKIDADQNRLTAWLQDDEASATVATGGPATSDIKTDAEVLEQLFWTALSRPPTAQERDALLAAVEQSRGQARERTGDPSQGRRAVFEDILWALINSKEFIFRP